MDHYSLAIGADKGPDTVALIALFLSVLSLFWMIWSEFTGYRRRQADEYWYREIFSPNCVEPLIVFLNEHLSSLQGLDIATAGVEETKNVCDEFAKKKEHLLERLWVSRLFSANYYSMACGQLDDVEDHLAVTLSGWVVKSAIATDRDIGTLRDKAIENVTLILSVAAKIDLNKFAKLKKHRKVP